ncbi:MAG: AAA family ATPase [Kiritimatiellae bacterium]|nr:AAA family ATPase [Kiritimatiellia bacterium]MDD5521506.1 AAA family ATPase [Kiritimatiellia bacterium]
MSEEKKESLEDQFKEIFKKANISFMMGPPPFQQSGGANEKVEDSQEKNADRIKPIREFNLKPRDIRDYLDRFVIKQDEAKKVLSVAICDHYNHVRRCLEDASFQETEYAKHNIILLGPTGVGKTYLMRCIAKLIGVPYVKADATKFSETGYVGHDVEDLVRDLVKTANGNTELAQYGIIYMDEIDKITAMPTAMGKDVSGRGVQINLLKLMEETDVSLFSQTDLIGQVQAVMDMQRGKGPGKRTINTRHMLFIVSGAFDKLPEIIKRRVSNSTIGFSQSESAGQKDAEIELLRLAQTKDFIDYGFEPEFIGRLPVRVVCEALAAEDLERIMVSSEGSILSQYRSDFAGYNIDFRMTPEAVKAVAQRAHNEKTGARGLMTVLERVFRNFKFELPSTGIKSFEVTGQMIEDSEAALEELLKKKEMVRREAIAGEIRSFAVDFQREHGLEMIFNKQAIDALVDLCLSENKSGHALCIERFRDCEYGLKMIARNTGEMSFTVTKKFIEDPAEELSRRIAKSFEKK